MVTRLSHVSIYVLDQEEAVRFYTEKLGFRVAQDQTMPNGYRWVTLNPPEQPELEVILMEPTSDSSLSPEQIDHFRELITVGAIGAGVLETKDCRKTYEEYKSRGVEFVTEPTEQFYGIEAILKDNSGNWFSMTERKS
jgi:catechol 2,3-dioxygenase-like lactoylglutathione lyase family enzyme